MTINYSFNEQTRELTVDIDTPEGTRLVNNLGLNSDNTVIGNIVTLSEDYDDFYIEKAANEATLDILKMNHNNYLETMDDFKKYKRVPKGWSKSYDVGELPSKLSTEDDYNPLHNPYITIKAPHLDSPLDLIINMTPQEDLRNYHPIAIEDADWAGDIFTTVATWEEAIEYIKNMTNEDME